VWINLSNCVNCVARERIWHKIFLEGSRNSKSDFVAITLSTCLLLSMLLSSYHRANHFEGILQKVLQGEVKFNSITSRGGGSQNVLKPTWLLNQLSWEKQGWAVQGFLYTYANVKDMMTFHSSLLLSSSIWNPSSKKVTTQLCLQLATDFFLRR